MVSMRLPRIAVALLAIPLMSIWNFLVTAGSRYEAASSVDSEAPSRIGEHERNWPSYIRGFHAHHGEDGAPDKEPGDGDFWEGLLLWLDSRFLRGYTIGNDVYVCPRTPERVRVHQAGHTPAFGEIFEPLVADYQADGGLPDEPLRTLDVMLPGDFPHTFLRLKDTRGLAGAYRAWLHDGTIQRVIE